MTNSIGENARKVADLASEKLGTAGEHIRDSAHNAKEKTQAAYASGKTHAGEALAAGKEKAERAYAGALDTAKDAQEKAAQKIQENPLSFVIGGVALGALVGALLPRTERESNTLGTAGKKISETARTAAKLAKEAGQSKLDELGVNKDAARDQVNQLFTSVVTAVEEAGAAAGKAVSSKADQNLKG